MTIQTYFFSLLVKEKSLNSHIFIPFSNLKEMNYM